MIFLNKTLRKRVLVTVLGALFLLARSDSVDADSKGSNGKKQSKSDENALIEHVAPFRSIPTSLNPGAPLKLTFTLNGSRNFDRPLKLLLVRDGNFSEEWVLKGSLTTNDVPIYTVTVPAPVSSIAYEAQIFEANSPVHTSSRFTLERDCIPILHPDELPLSENQGIAGLARTARVLEREIIMYEEAIALLEELNAKPTP